MTIEDILNDARSVVKKVVPDHVEITQVDFEGPTIVIYTKNMEVFAESNDLVRQIAQQLRRRIVVRPDPSLLATPEEGRRSSARSSRRRRRLPGSISRRRRAR